MKATTGKIYDGHTSDAPLHRLSLMRPYNLSTVELLAIIIGAGSGNSNGVELALKVLDICDHRLSNLTKRSIGDLMRVGGIGRAKAGALVAFAELSRRRQAEEALEETRIISSSDTVTYLAPKFRDLRYVAYGIMFLGPKGNIIKFEILFEGGIAGATVDIRIILHKALLHESNSIILCHNKVSDSAKPTASDDLLTERLKAASICIEIKLLDHIIIGERDHYSYADEGKLEQTEKTTSNDKI